MSLTLDEKQVIRSLTDIYFTDRDFINAIYNMYKSNQDKDGKLNGKNLNKKHYSFVESLASDCIDKISLKAIDPDCWEIFRSVQGKYIK